VSLVRSSDAAAGMAFPSHPNGPRTELKSLNRPNTCSQASFARAEDNLALSCSDSEALSSADDNTSRPSTAGRSRGTVSSISNFDVKSLSSVHDAALAGSAPLNSHSGLTNFPPSRSCFRRSVSKRPQRHQISVLVLLFLIAVSNNSQAVVTMLKAIRKRSCH
jgi:hypothetical protein